jgi:hypothetical protein
MHAILRIVVPAALALGLANAARASERCNDLNRELASLSESFSAPAKVRKYARAIAEQKLSIRELKNQMRETGCSGGSLFVLGGENAEECSGLEAKLARMEANLAVLNDKRLGLMTGQEEDSRRRRLARAITDSGCSETAELIPAEAVPQEAEEPATDLPEGYETIRVPQASEGYGDSQFVDLGGSATNGTFRTMCVRTCDGAYFPISSQASTMSFQRDAQVCSMMCPGMQTELFYHAITQESDAMRSAVTGRPYGDLENAYRFRTARKDQACGCNFALYYKEMMRREAFIADPVKAAPKQSSIVWVKPELRGQLAKEISSKPARVVALRDYKPDERIRQIGPKFLPDDDRLDLKVRTPNTEK